MAAGGPRLIDTPAAPAPSDALLETFQGAGGALLRAAYFPSIGAARGSVVLSPGRTEPIEKYLEVIGELRARGLAVVAHDWRGQGLSLRLDAAAGHGFGWLDYVADHRALVSAYEDRLPRPCLALAHSMGGCLVALAMADEPRIDGAIFSAPMFGVALRGKPRWLAAWAAAAMRWAGQGGRMIASAAGDPLARGFELNLLTHDRPRWDRHRAQLAACPQLGVGGPTWDWLDMALKATAAASRPGAAEAVVQPLVIVAAGQEALVVNAASRAFAARAPFARYVEIPDALHEILMEADPIRAAFWREFDALLASLSPQIA